MGAKETLKTYLKLFFLSLILTSCVSNHVNLQEKREINMASDMSQIYDGLVDRYLGNLSLENVIEIALQRNLDLLVKRREYQVQYDTTIREQLRMLPSLIANGELSGRNKELIVSSESVDPTVPPAPPSISTEEHVCRYDVNVVWNLLDFGLSYYKGRQETNRALILEFEFERIRQNVVVDVTKQYWKAISAKKALEEGKEIYELAKVNQEILQKQIQKRLISQLSGFRSEIQLISLQIQLRNFSKEYHLALSELAVTMGIPPCVEFDLAYEEEIPFTVELCDISELEDIALKSRPEVYKRDLEELIAEDDVRQALLSMIPGIELFAGTYFDANKFLTFNHWLAAGARASWNLFALPRHYYAEQVGQRKITLAQANRMAISVAILAQVRLAHYIYHDNLEQYLLADNLRIVNKNLLKAAKDELLRGVIPASEYLFYWSGSMIADVNAMKAYGEVVIALEQLNNAIGHPRYYRNGENVVFQTCGSNSCEN